MALQVWLPLNGNLNNQGLSNVTITNNGATVDNNGKIGKCYYFDGTDDRISCSALTIKYPMSIAGWFKPTNVTASATQYWISYNTNTGGTDGHSIGIGTYNGIPAVWYNGGVSNLSTSLSNNVWYHIAVTIDKNKKVAVYLNGASVATFTSTATQPNSTWITLGARSNSSTGGASGASYYYKGYMNDARVYDSCLSNREIELLSRGLVCHYPLNGSGRGGDNLLKNTGDLTLWTKEAGITTTWDSEKNLYKIVDSAHTSSRWGIYQDINVEANTSYTITVTLDGTACGAGFAVYDSSTSFPPAVISTTGRQSYTLTSGVNSTKARIYLYTNCGTSTTAWFGLPKVEKGSITTPWMPNPADSAYTAMGYDSTTIYDCSGYQNNATPWAYDSTGSIDITTDTPRYSTSTFINSANPTSGEAAGTRYIYGNCTLVKPEKLTLTFWCKPIKGYGNTTSHGIFSLTNYDIGQNAAVDYQEAPLNHRDGGFDVNGISGSTYTHKRLTVTFTTNEWHHYVITYDGRYAKLYKDGVQSTSADMGATMPLGSMKGIVVGFSKAGGVWRHVQSYYSDVRLYVTCLSDTQVAELYNTAVSVANNGTLMGYELVEV